jgi:hypothetical protein
VQPYVGIEPGRIPGREPERETEIRALQLQGDAIDCLKLNPSRTGNGKRRPHLDHVPPVTTGRHWSDFGVHGTGLVRLVLLNPEHHIGSGKRATTIGDPAFDRCRDRSAGGDGETPSLDAAHGADPPTKKQQQSFSGVEVFPPSH